MLGSILINIQLMIFFAPTLFVIIVMIASQRHLLIITEENYNRYLLSKITQLFQKIIIRIKIHSGGKKSRLSYYISKSGYLQPHCQK